MREGVDIRRSAPSTPIQAALKLFAPVTKPARLDFKCVASAWTLSVLLRRCLLRQRPVGEARCRSQPVAACRAALSLQQSSWAPQKAGSGRDGPSG